MATDEELTAIEDEIEDDGGTTACDEVVMELGNDVELKIEDKGTMLGDGTDAIRLLKATPL